MKDRYEKESFSKIVSESFSIAEVGKKLGLRRAGGVYSTIAKYIQKGCRGNGVIHFLFFNLCKIHNFF